MRKLIYNSLLGGVYELTKPTNSRLSEWNTRAVIVDKVKNPKPSDEPRIIFDYSKVYEDLLGYYLKISSKVHNYLSNPRYSYLFVADLKYTYLIILLY